MAPQRCSTIQEEVQHYEAEVAERQKSLQEMKAGREWPNPARIPDMSEVILVLLEKNWSCRIRAEFEKCFAKQFLSMGKDMENQKFYIGTLKYCDLIFWFPYLLFDLTLFRFVLLFIQKVLRDAITHNLSQEEFSSELKDAGAVLPHKRARFWWFNDWPMVVERRTLSLSQQAEVTRKHAWGIVLCNFYKARKKQLDVGHHVLLRTIVTYFTWNLSPGFLYTISLPVYIPSVTGHHLYQIPFETYFPIIYRQSQSCHVFQTKWSANKELEHLLGSVQSC